MLIETKGIVINTFKYGDNSLIARCFTQSYGLQSFLLKGILKTKQGGIRKSQFQALTQLNLSYNFKSPSKLQFLKEVKVLNLYKTIPVKISKNTLVLFLSEVLKNVIKDDGPNNSLFIYLETSLNWLDNVENVKNFHVIFLIKLTKFLGFYPNYSSEGIYFDIENGCFTNVKKNSSTIEGLYVKVLRSLLGMNFGEVESIKLNRASKHQLIEIILRYFDFHLDNFLRPKSLSVLHELFEKT
tara:strand:- start:33 stop:755 length:723 start_codon:yes stop_codon:yes gene_type:complete